MAGLYDLTRRERRALRKASPAFQRAYLRDRENRRRQEELLRMRKSNAEAEAGRKQKAEAEKTAKADREKWEKSLFEDKNNSLLKQLLAAQGFDAMTKDDQVMTGDGLVMAENPELTKLKGMLRGIPGLSRENIANHVARIALQNRPDIYTNERITEELTPFLSAHADAGKLLASFQKDPLLLADYIVRKGSGMTHRDALQSAMDARNKAAEQTETPEQRDPRDLSDLPEPARLRVFMGTGPTAAKLAMAESLRRNDPDDTPTLSVNGSSAEEFRSNFLNTGTMRRHIRHQEAERRREQDALGLSDALFNKIRSQTAAGKRERLENGEAQYLIARNEYEKAKQDGQPAGAAPDRKEFLVNAMNIGRTIPNTDPAYRYYSPNAAALADQPHSYNSREFYPGLHEPFTPEEVKRQNRLTAEAERRINPRPATPSLSALTTKPNLLSLVLRSDLKPTVLNSFQVPDPEPQPARQLPSDPILETFIPTPKNYWEHFKSRNVLPGGF